MALDVRSWSLLAGALLLVLLLWTGAATHAAEAADHRHESLHAIAHAEGENRLAQDQRDSQAIHHHHHIGDGGHHLALLGHARQANCLKTQDRPSFANPSNRLAGHGPPIDLRPPIA